VKKEQVGIHCRVLEQRTPYFLPVTPCALRRRHSKASTRVKRAAGERRAFLVGRKVTPPYGYKKKMYGTLKIRGFKAIFQCAKMKDQKEGIL